MTKLLENKAPPEFLRVFRFLVTALQPRGLERDAVEVYWLVLGHFPIAALEHSASDLTKTSSFFPTTGEWFFATISYVSFHDGASEDWRQRLERARAPDPLEGSRTLDELDDLAPNDPERDEICKRLSVADQTALMARYGYALDGRRLAAPASINAVDPVDGRVAPDARAKEPS